MAQGGPSFIGFGPEDKQKAMNTLTKVIELKDKNRAAAEESRGFEIAEEDKYAQRYKPLIDAISTASGDIIKYTNEGDLKFAAREVVDAISQLRTANAQAASDPANQGYVALVNAYGAQANYAKAKMEYLEAAEKYTKATAAQKPLAESALQNARDDYAAELAAFQSVQIPLGFKQTVSIQQPPAAGSVFPGAQLGISPNPAVPAVPPPVLVAKVPPKGPPPPAPAPGLVGGPPPPITKKAPPPLTTKKAPPPTAAIPLSGVKWADDLLKLRQGVDNIPAKYRNASDGAQFVPGSIAISKLPTDTKQVVEIKIMDPLGKEMLTGLIHVLSPKDLTMSFILPDKTIESFTAPFVIENIFRYPSGALTQRELTYLILTHAKLFGGWGNHFWGGVNPGDKSDFLKKVFFNPSYKKAVSEALKLGSKFINPKTVGEGAATATGLKFKTKATPKASTMRLGPDGEYGDLVIDVQALYNDGRLIARERGDQYGSNVSGGTIKLDEVATPGLKNLVSKRAMQTTIDKSPTATQKQLKRLRKLAGFKAATTGGFKMKPTTAAERDSGVVIVSDPKELMNRLRVATGVYEAGNRSKKSASLISELATALYHQGHLSQDKFEKILQNYRPE